MPIAIEEQLADGVLTLEGAAPQSQTSAGGGEAGTFTYLHREYVWGPGDRGIDELLAVFTGTHPNDGLAPRTPWYAITDTGGDVVALVEITSPGTPTAQAHVAAQWTYDPYGNVQSADYLRPHPHISVGHKGLFAERLDVPLMYAFGDPAHPTLTPFSRIHYHTRNRVLDPTLGRWLQRDPNATGQTVVDVQAMLGKQSRSGLHEADLLNHLADGINTHAYVRSSPTNNSDAMGLFSFLDLLGGSGTSLELYSDYNQEMIGYGGSIRRAMSGGLQATALFQMIDVDWATDWSARDDDYFAAGNVDYTPPPADTGIGVFINNDPYNNPIMASVDDTEAIVRGMANASRHGKEKHRKYMGVLALAMMRDLGLSLSEVDIVFNRVPRDASGKAIAKVRPDILIYDKAGKLLHVGEVAVSQSAKQLADRIARLQKLLPHIRRPGDLKVPYK